jgi:hypothetical protein
MRVTARKGARYIGECARVAQGVHRTGISWHGGCNERRRSDSSGCDTTSRPSKNIDQIMHGKRGGHKRLDMAGAAPRADGVSCAIAITRLQRA